MGAVATCLAQFSLPPKLQFESVPCGIQHVERDNSSATHLDDSGIALSRYTSTMCFEVGTND